MRLTGGRLVPWDPRGLPCRDEANLWGSVLGDAWRMRLTSWGLVPRGSWRLTLGNEAKFWGTVPVNARALGQGNEAKLWGLFPGMPAVWSGR